MRTRRTSVKNHRTNAHCTRLSIEQLEARQLMAADLVIQWNDATIDAIRSDPGSANPGDGSRVFALVHTAIYDAWNAIAKKYSNFALTTEAPDWASKEAAIATAARNVLAGLYPTQASKFQSLWQQNLAAIPDGAAENAGVAIGQDAAQTILDLRANDGSKGGSNYQVTDAPGHWDVDPLNPNQVAWGPNWGNVTPFAMRSVNDFSVPPPPALTSQEYAAAYNEVKSLGALNSTTRTADQTEIGIFWGYDRPAFGPPTVLYNQNVQEIAEQKGNSLEDNVRLFAMFNVAMADTGIATWKAKFDYDLWRPITAIREGDMDGNPLTIADPNWIPLGAPGPNPNSSADDFTPPFPAYTSGHAGFGAAVFRTLARFYGSDQFSFTLTSEELPGVTRSYSSFSQAAEENGRSRIYLGIHWEFDNSQGQILGNRVADYVATGMFIRRSDSTMIEIQRHGAGFRAGVLPSGTPIDIVVEGNSLKIINHRTGALIYHEPVNQVASIRIDQRNQATDFARIIVATGTVMPQSLVLEIVGNENWFDGMGLTTGDGNDHVVLNGDTLQAYGVTPPIHLYGIGYVDIGTHGGNDILAVHGDQRGRQVDLGGYGGNDWYEIWSTNAKLYVSDTAGYDSFSFENLNAGIYFDMELNAGQLQPLAGNSLFMWGWFEAVIGTMFADVLMGTQYDNFLDGRKGDDTIHGRAGNDTLYGGQGNDLLYGNLGDDVIYGHKGNDILLGGFGNDYLYGGDDADLLIGSQGVDWLFGEAGDDILIGGTTTHDFDAVALRAILAEWTSSRSRTIRQLNIQSGTGSTTRLNGKYYLKTGTGGTVIDDKEADTLVKGANDAWVFSFTRDTTRT